MAQTKVSTENVLIMERAISVLLLKSTSSLVVKCLERDKKPASGWDPRANTVEASAQTLRDIEFTKDNVGIHLTGKWMDVDVDVDDGDSIIFHALDAFLPNTPHIWGRASKPKSHRLYMASDQDFDPANHIFLTKLKRIPEAKVEVRGGPVSSAQYSLMPGSIHPSGELYTWESNSAARSTPVMVPVKRVLDAVRKATAVAVLAPYFTEGVRQELTMALSGFLQRVHSLTSEWAEETGGFVLDYSDALDFFKTFLKLVDDDKADFKSRLAAFKMSWDKGVEGKNVTGATRIAEIAGDKGVVQKLYALLADNPDLQRLETFLQRYAIWYGTGDFVDLDAAELGTKAIMSRQAASNSMGHEWYQVGDKRVKMVDYLYNLDSTTRVHGFDFAPGKGSLISLKNGTIKVNQWGGFEVEPGLNAQGKTPTEEDVAPFIDYMMRVISGDRQDVFQWVMGWLADILADPSDKPGTSLVLVGPPGAGKSSLGDIIRAIIGDKHTAQTNDIERVVAKHNTNMINNLFIQCDEATNSRQRAITARLKSLITDRTQTCEPKNVDAYEVSALARFMFTSNDEVDAMHIPDGLRDRRFTVVKVAEDRVGDIAYWDEFRGWWSDNLGMIAGYLKHYQYNKRLIRWCLDTPEKARMVTASWTVFDRWITFSIDTAFPLTNRAHETPHVTLANADDRPSEIKRTEWPEYVSIVHLAHTMAELGRGSGPGRAAPTSADVVLDLTRAGLLASSKQLRVNAVEYDERTGTRKLMTYTYVKLADLETFKKYARRMLGHGAAEIDDVVPLKYEGVEF